MLERKWHIDILRIILMYGIVLLHTISAMWGEVTINSRNFEIMMIYETVTRCGVPVFFMISGALMLDKNKQIKLKKLYLHNILHLVIVYFIWSFILALFDAVRTGQPIVSENLIKSLVDGYWHLWFLPPLIGIYIVIPVFRAITMKEKTTRYFTTIAFIFAVVFPFINQMSLYIHNDALKKSVANLNTMSGKFDMKVVCNYGLYFILGYYLEGVQSVFLWKRKILYTLGAISMALACALNIISSEQVGSVSEPFAGHYNLLIYMSCIAVFVFVKSCQVKLAYRIERDSTLKTIIKEISDNCLGIYVLHILVRNILVSKGVHALSFNPFFAAPLVALLIFSIACVITMLIRRIPIIGKWIL